MGIASGDIWQRLFGPDDFLRYPVLTVPLKWLEGLDTLRVEMVGEGGDAPQVHVIEGCFLNVNALDMGIEVDRVAKMHLDSEVLLFDGEVHGDSLVDSPVGLFDADQLNAKLGAGERSFLPDFFFYGAQHYEGSGIDYHVQEFVHRMRRHNRPEDMVAFDRASAEERFALCPVTERIIRRYSPLHPKPGRADANEYGVFISFASEDEQLARAIYDGIRPRSRREVFFSPASVAHSRFKREIDKALGQASTLIVVASRGEHTLKDWVEYEWNTYQIDVLNQKRDGQVISILDGVQPGDLPINLRTNQMLMYNRNDPEAVIHELSRYLPN